MMNRNYSKELDALIEKNKRENIKPKLMLHACCACCASYVLEYLSEHFEIYLLFYNPNITSVSEYDYRYSELKRLVSEMGLSQKVTIVESDYSPDEFMSSVKGLENEPERGGRCLKCFKLRLLRTAQYARQRGIKVITTTLASSRWKSLDQINEAGQWACTMPLGAVDVSRLGVKTVPPDDRQVIWWNQNWRKGGLQERRNQILKEYDFYNQRYCGCEFSMPKDDLTSMQPSLTSDGMDSRE